MRVMALFSTSSLEVFFFFFFFLNLSFKIAMSGRAGGLAGLGRRPRCTFWLTFFQSCMVPLFFSGLLSYLVGMKRRTSRCVTCKRDNSHFVRYVLISPDIRMPKVYLLANLFSKLYLPLFFSGLLSYLVRMKRRTSRCVKCKRDNSHFVRYVLISPDV